MKKSLIWLAKAAIAGVLALTALCLFCCLYANVPVHYANETGATEYYWEPHRFYSGMTEGFGHGRVNNEGFNNLLDHSPGDGVDILLMGSSHMDAHNVMQDENAAAVLNRLFRGEKYTYNIGMAGHSFTYSVKHLDAALNTYEPAEYVLLENYTLYYSDAELEAVLHNELPAIPSHTGGLIELLQKLPYLRLIYTKYFKGMNNADDIQANAAAVQVSDPERNAQLLNEMMVYVSECCKAHNVTPVVVFEAVLRVDEQGNAYCDIDPDKLKELQCACEENGIVFADLSGAFLREYELSHRLPFGFANTVPGSGHLNKLGHELFAETVYAVITEREG